MRERAVSCSIAAKRFIRFTVIPSWATYLIVTLLLLLYGTVVVVLVVLCWYLHRYVNTSEFSGDDSKRRVHLSCALLGAVYGQINVAGSMLQTCDPSQ